MSKDGTWSPAQPETAKSADEKPRLADLVASIGGPMYPCPNCKKLTRGHGGLNLNTGRRCWVPQCRECVEVA